MTWRSRRRAALCLVVWMSGLSACAGKDPWEDMNRGTFWFNQQFDRFLLEPAARGWDWVLPEFAQTGVRNFFDNLGFPIDFVNALLQLKPIDAGEDLARFVVNTTVGVVGFVDVASRIDIPKNDEDFGQTLGSYGVPAGPYLVLPLLGPASLRDGPSLAVDGATQPLNWVLPFVVNAAARGVDVVSQRAYFIEEIEQAERDAFDYYVFRRDAYLSNREHRVADRAAAVWSTPEDEDEDLYFPEEDDEDLYFPEEDGE